jgi:SepF-like predicted cell division protein (DUF552 family)
MCPLIICLGKRKDEVRKWTGLHGSYEHDVGKKEALDKKKEKAKEERFMLTLEIEKATLELEKKRAENEAEVQKKRVENEAKLAEANLMKEEKEIMLADMSSLSPTQRSWIEIMQKKILAKLISS